MKAEITQLPNVTTNGVVKTSGGNGTLSVSQVVASEIASDAVTTAKILDANVTEAKLATDSVSTAKIVDGAVANTKIQDSTINITKFNTTTLRRMARAWVNFNAVPQTGTYNLPNLSSTLTVTIATHGLTVGQIVSLDFTSGTMPDGVFTILTTPTANTFTVDAGFTENGGGRSGNVTKQINIRKANGIGSITDNGVGDFTVNFSSPMNDASYATVVTGTGSGCVIRTHDDVTARTTSLFRILAFASNTGTALDPSYVSILVFGE